MKNKRENGEVVVEASIIVTLVFIVLSIMFYIGMVLYQQTAISTVANRTATNISQVYSNTLRDPFTGYVDPDNAYQPVTYKNMKTDAYLDVIKQKGTAFAQYRLKRTQIISAVDRQVEVQVVNKPNEILKAQIVVTITDSYDVPLVGIFNADGKLSFSSTGRADCVDYLEYLLGVEAIADPESAFVPVELDTCLVTFIKDKYSGAFHTAVPVLREETILTSNRYSHSTMPKNPELNGMKFTGWVTDDGKTFSAATKIDRDMTIYGTWDCDITFDPTGGTVDITSKNVGYKKTTIFPKAQKNGFKFLGWFSDVEYSEKYKSYNGTGTQYFDNATEIPGNITLYAKWECLHETYNQTLLSKGDCQTNSIFKRTCNICGYYWNVNGDVGPHIKGEKKVIEEPSCQEEGLWVIRCSKCSKILDNGNIDKISHKEDEGTVTKEATCTTAGTMDIKCRNCGIHIRYETIDALGHDDRGRCGETHILRNTLGKENNGCLFGNTKKFQCVVCSRCGEYAKATGSEYGHQRELSNGEMMTIRGRKWCVSCEEEGIMKEEYNASIYDLQVRTPKLNGEVDKNHPKENQVMK